MYGREAYASTNLQIVLSPLLKLPVEVLQQIIDYIANPDIENTALSCSYLHNVARGQLIRHREWKRRYSRVSWGKISNGWGDQFGEHPAKLLERILTDHRIASYPSVLTIGDCSHHQDNSKIGDLPRSLELEYYNSASTSINDLRYEIYQAARDFCYHTPRCARKCISDVWDNLMERVLALHKNPIITLLLRLLPNVEVLRYSSQDYPSPLWFELLSKIAEESRAHPGLVFPLSKLHTVEIDRAYMSSAFLISVIGLPSLRSVRILGELASRTCWSLPISLPATVGIITLSIDGCYSSVNFLTEVMSRIPNLQEFRYKNAGFNPSKPYPRAPSSIVECLLQHASHSLVSLTIVGYSGTYCSGSIGSLRGFKNLRHIQIDVPMLVEHPRKVIVNDMMFEVASEGIDISYNDDDLCMEKAVKDIDTVSSEDERDVYSDYEVPSTWYLDVAEQASIVHQLINILPASAETLTLEMAADKNIMLQMLSRLPERKTERLPHLKEVLYQCEERCVLGIEDECERLGLRVAQVLKYGAIKNCRRDSLDSEDACARWGWWLNYNDPEDCNSYYDYDYNDDDVAEYASSGSPNPSLNVEAENPVSDDVPSCVYEDIEAFEWLVRQAPDSSWS